MLDSYTGSDPMSVLFVEAYLAGTRDERLRQEFAAVIADLRRGSAALRSAALCSTLVA